MKKKYNYFFIILGVTHHNKFTKKSASNTFLFCIFTEFFWPSLYGEHIANNETINTALKLLVLPPSALNIPFFVFPHCQQ